MRTLRPHDCIFIHLELASLFGLFSSGSHLANIGDRTLPHHLSWGEEQLAEEIAHLGEEIWVELTNELATEPKRPVEIILVDHTDSANGYAMTVPVNTIVIFCDRPQRRLDALSI